MIAIDGKTLRGSFSRLLKNVSEAANARKKQAKERIMFLV